MTLREMLCIIAGPVKLVVHKTNGPSEIQFETSAPRPATMLSSLEAVEPRLLNISVTTVSSENSTLTMGAGSFFNDGPASTVIHIVKRNAANELD